MWWRAWDSEQWVPGTRLLVHLDDGGGEVPAQLSWATEGGAQCAVGFSPDMASCYGHRRTANGDVVEVRGELDDPRDHPKDGYRDRGYEFDTRVQDTDGWLPAGRLRVLVEEGSEAPARWVAWHDRSGNACSVALRAARPSGNEEVSDLVTVVRASAEHHGAGEVAANLVDASTSKWFAFEDRASLEFHLTGPVPVDRYMLTSANDAPDRDPAAWTLRGSADGRRWRTLDARTGQSFPGRHRSQMYRIAEPAAFARYRLEITGNNGSPHLQLEAVRLFADIGGFVGYRQRVGHAPAAYHGIRVVRASPDVPAPQLPEDASPPSEWQSGCSWLPLGGTLSMESLTLPEDASPPSEWQSGCSWLPLGGTLSMESLTSPSGRFTVLDGAYGPQLAIRDNLTREYVWVSDAQSSSLLSLGPDGDFVAWDHHGRRVWSTGTAWRGVRRLDMRDTGELTLTDAHGGVVWSSGIPEISAASGELRTVARGSTMHRGESLYGQSLTSDDGSTVLFHDGRVLRCIVKGRTSHWDRYYDRQNVLELDEDGFLRTLALDGSEMERIAGPGTELVVARGAAELRDETGAVVWASANSSTRIGAGPVREPTMPHNDALAAWFAALMGQGHGFCVAVVKESTPAEVLARVGVTSDSAVQGTWRELQQHQEAVGEGSIAAAIAVGPDVILLSDDAALPLGELASLTSCAAVHAPSGGNGYGTRFSLHQRGLLVSEFMDQPRREKGAEVPEVAAALAESVHHLHRFELLFRVSGVVPSAEELGGVLLGGVLAPRPTPVATPDTEDDLPPLVIGERDELSPLVIRTDFTDEDAWNRVLAELQEPWMENEAEPYIISESAYDGVPAERIIKAVLVAMSELELPGVVFIADATTMREEKHPLLAVSTEWDGEPFAQDEDAFTTQFRIRPNAAIEVSCNLGIANMDFEDFAGDGVGERMVD
ncbi:hypothetical protein ABTZ58_35520 [Streptomyces sp. NPDC094143]|uniref:DUF6924 domain-containing protein n=1 Tax=Streptomyces sp. NPDC094143 TaxID=3155310 RepID=UPI00332DB0F1